jgi:hypothetical protein
VRSFERHQGLGLRIHSPLDKMQSTFDPLRNRSPYIEENIERLKQQ